MDHQLQSSANSSSTAAVAGISPALLQAIAQTLSTGSSTTVNTGATGSIVSPRHALMSASAVSATHAAASLTTATQSRPITRPIIAVKVLALELRMMMVLGYCQTFTIIG